MYIESDVPAQGSKVIDECDSLRAAILPSEVAVGALVILLAPSSGDHWMGVDLLDDKSEKSISTTPIV